MVKKILRHGYIIALAGSFLIASACSDKDVSKTVSTPKQAAAQAKDNVVEAPGKIKANDSKNIILDFSASVQTVHVKGGQHVKQGDELITLDIHDIKQQIFNKEKDLSQARLQLEVSTNDIASAEKELEREKSEYGSETDNNASTELKENDYKNAQDELNRAKEDLASKEALYETGAVSKNDLTTAQRRVQDAEKAVANKYLALSDGQNGRKDTMDKLETGISQQTAKVNNLKLNIEIQKQKIEVLESDIKQLKDKLSKSYIKEDKVVSDVKNGVVQEIAHVAGDFVQANTKLLNLVDLDSMVIEADVSEDFIKDVKSGAEVVILPLSDSSRQYKGRVLKIADVGVEKNGETVITTEISIDNPDEYIKPDFSVDVKISK